MNGNRKYPPEKPERHNPENQKDSVFLYIEQFRAIFSKYPEVLKQLDLIEQKLKRVSHGVQSVMEGMLKLEIAHIQASSASSTAAIMAANDERFRSAA